MSTQDQLLLPLPHRAAMGRGDFMVADSNRLAVGWIDRWPDWPGPLLTLHGPEGSGKSHLTTVWCTQSGAARIEPEDLPRQDPLALAERGAVAIDDAERIANEPDGERALLHLYNLLREDHGHLLLAAREPVTRWALRLPDLRSRLAAGVAVALEPPDDVLLQAVLAKLFQDRQVAVRREVLQYLVPRMERSFSMAARLVERLDLMSLSGQRPITVPMGRDAIAALTTDSSA